MSVNDAIYAENLGRSFKHGRDAKEAVKGLTFRVKHGETFGFLGPNGAGKTTTIKMLTTLLLPTEGDAHVAGFSIRSDPDRVRRCINFTFGGERGLYNRLTAFQNLRFFADLYLLPDKPARERIAHLLDLVGLADVAGQRVETFSKGMKQRLHIARALINKPQILFLDEPTLGLDPLGNRQLRELIRLLNLEGVTVFLTTHDMFDVEALCSNIVFIQKGKVCFYGQIADLKAQLGLDFLIEAKLLRNLQPSELNLLHNMTGRNIEVNELVEASYRIRFHRPELGPEILNVLSTVGLRTLSQSEPTLEDAYVRITQ